MHEETKKLLVKVWALDTGLKWHWIFFIKPNNPPPPKHGIFPVLLQTFFFLVLSG